jgi:RNA binding exosome subunit
MKGRFSSMIKNQLNRAVRSYGEEKRRFLPALLVLIICLLAVPQAQAGMRDRIKKVLNDRNEGSGELDTNTIAAGLKEALSVGTRNSVTKVSQVDGYFGNQLIRIAAPEKIKKIEKVMRKAGLGKYVDKFILSMNRAAEKAAPQALEFFVAAVKEMTIPDAVAILRGNDMAATDYLKSKTFDRIYGAFKPVVTATMNDVGVTRSFKEMMDKARTVPLLKNEVVDLDHYVTSKTLDGLFTMVGQEEQKIRKDPAARVTELLKKVFKK